MFIGKMQYYEPEWISPKIPAVASTDGIGGRDWFTRFLLWHGLAIAGVVGLFVGEGALWQGLLITVVAAAGAADTWRWWRYAWRRVAEHYSVYNW